MRYPMLSVNIKLRNLMIVVVSVLIFAFIAHGQTQAKWESAAPFPAPAEELYGVAANGKMYVIGGFGDGGRPMGIVYEYDPSADAWTQKKSMPVPAHHAALAELNGKIYVLGGFVAFPVQGAQGAGWQPVGNAWEYDPVGDSWKALAPLPTKRGSPLAAVVNGKIYVIGGATLDPGSNEVAILQNHPARSVGTNEAYDPQTGTWEARNPMPTARNHTFGGTVSGKIYVIGGRLGSPFIGAASNTDVVEEYDPAINQWGAPKAKMPTPRSGGGWAIHSNRIYVAGGEINTLQLAGAFRALEAYDPGTNTWAILSSMPNPRHGVAAAFLGDHLHLVSGKITSGGYSPGLQLSTSEHDVIQIADK